MSVFTMTATAYPSQIDWKIERDRIDLAQVARELLGPPEGRGRERGLWWRCPFHDDRNPSFQVDPSRRRWRCWGCGANGNALDLAMRLLNLTFPEAMRRLTGGPLGPTTYRPPPPSRPARPPGPSGLSASEAVALVAESHARLWTPEGSEALAYLTGKRRLTPETIRAARLGWTPGVRLPTAKGGQWTARGWTIPWLDGDRLAKVNIRQPDGSTPKYAQTFQAHPTMFSGTPGIPKPGTPLVVVEGELDALLLGQELADLAVVVSLGSASAHPDPTTLDRLGRYRPWHTAHDADPSGDQAAAMWPARSRRVRPPIGKDWTEAAQAGVNLGRWWSDRLGGISHPEAFTWIELSPRRWGPGIDDPEPGIIIDHPDRERLELALQAYVKQPADPSDPEVWPEGRD